MPSNGSSVVCLDCVLSGRMIHHFAVDAVATISPGLKQANNEIDLERRARGLAASRKSDQ